MPKFNVLKQEYVPKIDTNIYYNVLRDQGKQYKELVDTKTELEKAIYSLPIHESEKWILDEYYDKINKTINLNTSLGVNGVNYEKLKNIEVDILKDKRITDRLKANASYELFKNTILNDTTLTDEEKELRLSMDTYEKGVRKTLNGYEWKNKFNIVPKINTNELLKDLRLGLQYMNINDTKGIKDYIDFYMKGHPEIEESIKQDWNFNVERSKRNTKYPNPGDYQSFRDKQINFPKNNIKPQAIENKQKDNSSIYNKKLFDIELNDINDRFKAGIIDENEKNKLINELSIRYLGKPLYPITPRKETGEPPINVDELDNLYNL